MCPKWGHSFWTGTQEHTSEKRFFSKEFNLIYQEHTKEFSFWGLFLCSSTKGVPWFGTHLSLGVCSCVPVKNKLLFREKNLFSEVCSCPKWVPSFGTHLSLGLCSCVPVQNKLLFRKKKSLFWGVFLCSCPKWVPSFGTHLSLGVCSFGTHLSLGVCSCVPVKNKLSLFDKKISLLRCVPVFLSKRSALIWDTSVFRGVFLCSC